MIKSLRDRQRMLPRIGKIHLGVMNENAQGREFPRAVDYFVVEESDTTPAEAVAAFREVYGDEPRALKIEFPTDDEAVIFDVWLKAYSRKNLVYCKGDEEWATRTQDDGSKIEIPCTEDCQLLQSKKCRRVGILRFLLPDVPGFGIWQLDTGSWNSFKGVLDGLDLLRLAFGRISGISLTLRLVPKVVEVDGKPKTVYILTLTDYATKLSDVRALMRGQPVAQLPVSPVNDDEAPEDLFPRSQLDGQVLMDQENGGLSQGAGSARNESAGGTNSQTGAGGVGSGGRKWSPTQRQAERFHSKATAAGLDDDARKALLSDFFGVESVTDIAAREDYDEICSHLDGLAVAKKAEEKGAGAGKAAKIEEKREATPSSWGMEARQDWLRERWEPLRSKYPALKIDHLTQAAGLNAPGSQGLTAALEAMTSPEIAEMILARMEELVGGGRAA